MNDLYIILFKTAIFITSYLVVSSEALKFFLKRNPSAKYTDVEIVVVSTISAVFITTIARHTLKFFII